MNTQNIKSTNRNKYHLSLLKEAASLIDRLEKIDKKIERELKYNKNILRIVIDDIAQEIASEAVNEAIKNVLRILVKNPTKIHIDLFVKAIQPHDMMSKKDAYLDTRPFLAQEIIDSKKRLEEIKNELFHNLPPQQMSFSNKGICIKESCISELRAH